MSRKSLYNNVMQVKRLKLSEQDDIGGITQTRVTVYQQPCRISRLNSIERFVGGNDGVVSTHRIYCDDCSIGNKDEVIVDGYVFDVKFVAPHSSKSGLQIDVTLRT